MRAFVNLITVTGGDSIISILQTRKQIRWIKRFAQSSAVSGRARIQNFINSVHCVMPSIPNEASDRNQWQGMLSRSALYSIFIES